MHGVEQYNLGVGTARRFADNDSARQRVRAATIDAMNEGKGVLNSTARWREVAVSRRFLAGGHARFAKRTFITDSKWHAL